MNSDWENNEEIQIFQEYLRIPTVHPDINYDDCIEFLKKQALGLDLSYEIYYPGGITKPLLVVKWAGTEPELPAIMLSSHTDVVPVFEEFWTYPPFAAHIDEQGRIYAPGTQDMKCNGTQYLAAIRALKRENVRLKRTVLLTFVPDEETGGYYGMNPFVKTDEFKNLNIGFTLDEGMASPKEDYLVFYGERTGWHITFNISGPSGHGSLLNNNTVGEKVQYLLNKFSDFRASQAKRLEDNPDLSLGDVTTVNLTVISGGVGHNVVPPKMKLHFDIRLSLEIDQVKFEDDIRRWMEEAGGGIELVFDSKIPFIPPTPIVGNPFVDAFKNATDQLGLKIKMRVFPAGTDSQEVRGLGIPAIGFSAINFTPVLFHTHNEFIGADTYLRGIDIWKQIISNVANC